MNDQLKKVVMKILLASSKKDQGSSIIMTEEAITKMYYENDNEIPLKVNDEIVGHLIRKELIKNEENEALELWGYFAIENSQILQRL